MKLAAYDVFPRAAWAGLRASTPLPLTETDLAELRGAKENVSLDEVVEVYLPLSRLLNLHVRAARSLGAVKGEFLGRLTLQALLARWPERTCPCGAAQGRRPCDRAGLAPAALRG
jgi:pantothenate kinase